MGGWERARLGRERPCVGCRAQTSRAKSDLRGGRNRVGLTSGAKLMVGGRVGRLQGTQLSLLADASCRCQIWGCRRRASTVSAVGQAVWQAGTGVPRYSACQAVGKSVARELTRELFLGPSLSWKAECSSWAILEGERAYLVPEVFHFLPQTGRNILDNIQCTTHTGQPVCLLSIALARVIFFVWSSGQYSS